MGRRHGLDGLGLVAGLRSSFDQGCRLASKAALRSRRARGACFAVAPTPPIAAPEPVGRLPTLPSAVEAQGEA